MRPRTLLIDLDNTLVRVNRNRAWLCFFRIAVPTMILEFGMVRGISALISVMSSVKQALPGLTIEDSVATRLALKTGISVREAHGFLGRLLERAAPRLEPHFMAVSEAIHFIAWAKRRYRLILATNPVWPRPFAELRLAWAGIDAGAFADITTSNTMRHAKPDPAYYLEILLRHGLQAQDCLMIGDSRKNDLPAEEVGIAVHILERPARGFRELTRVLEEGKTSWPRIPSGTKHSARAKEAAPC